ncbi:MAG: helix-turn-helix domain-containing protein [Candidatus Micrarchaeota archaeon]
MKMDMTCIDISIEDLLGCSFGLSRREVSILLRMLDAGGWMPVSTLAARSRRDRSVVQRGLASLMERGLVMRDHRNRARGGYEFIYRAADKGKIRKAVLEKSARFSSMVEGRVRDW